MKTLNTRKRAVIVLVYLLVIITGITIVLRNIQISSDMSAFLPRGATQVQKIIFTQFKQAANSRAVLIGIEGNDQVQLIAINKSISQQLKKSKLFSVVNNGQSALPAKEFNLLFKNRFALSDTTGEENYRIEKLRSHLQKRLASLSSALAPVIKKTLPRDPAGEFENILDKLKSDVTTRKINGIYFSGDNKRTLILAIPAAQATNLNQQQLAIDTIKNTYEKIDHAGTKLVLAGPIIIALSAKEKIRNDVRTLSMSATLIVIAFLYFAFRSLRIVLLSVLPLASGMLAGVVAATLLFETVHGITIAFGATLIGIAVDYPMHFFSHLNGRKTPRESMNHIWGTLRLSVVTTIIGFSSLLLSGYGGLSQLAVFSIFGIIAAVLTTRFLLPSVLADNFMYESPISRLTSAFKNYALQAEKLWPVLILLIIFSVTILMVKSNLLGDGRNQIWNDNLSALSPASEKQLLLDKKLRNDLNLRHSNSLIIVTGETQEAVLQSAEILGKKLDNLADLSVSYEIITKYLPSIKEQNKRLQQIPDEKILRNNMKQASEGLPFRKNLFEPFFKDLEIARQQQPVTLESFSGTILADKLSPLLFKTGNNTWATTLLLYDMKNPEVIKELLQDNPENRNWTYVKLSEETKKIMVEYRQRALLVFSFGALAIICALWAGMGSLRGAISIAAVPFSVLLVNSAMLTLFNVELTLFHLVAMLLVAGLGIDYALFFNRIRIDAKEWETSFPAIWKSWLTTILVFGSLALSDTVVLGALGLTVTLGVSLSFLFGLIVTRKFSLIAA